MLPKVFISFTFFSPGEKVKLTPSLWGKPCISHLYSPESWTWRVFDGISRSIFVPRYHRYHFLSSATWQVRVTACPWKRTVHGGWREITGLDTAAEERRDRVWDRDPCGSPVHSSLWYRPKDQDLENTQGSHLGRSVIAQGHLSTGAPRGEWLLRDDNEQNYFKKATPAGFTDKCQWEKWLVSLVWILEKATPAPWLHHAPPKEPPKELGKSQVCTFLKGSIIFSEDLTLSKAWEINFF